MPRFFMSASAPLRSRARRLPPWPSGLRASESFSASKQLPVIGKGRHHSLLEEEDVGGIAAEIIVSSGSRRAWAHR